MIFLHVKKEGRKVSTGITFRFAPHFVEVVFRFPVFIWYFKRFFDLDMDLFNSGFRLVEISFRLAFFVSFNRPLGRQERWGYTPSLKNKRS